MPYHKKLMQDEGYIIGCNYWASHAGLSMWSDWNPEIVEEDFKKLSGAGLQVLRVFPLWPDFQPLNALYGGNGILREYRFGEKLLPDNEAGQAGVSTIAISHFEELAQLANKYNFKLIVGLVTGWMSGRLFVPSAFEGKNILTDPTVIIWQVRFVKYFVNYFKNNSAILAWDLGNECNCITDVPTRELAWQWTSSIANAIRSKDNSRHIVSGMHSLTPTSIWTMQDQGELTDILTTHPYTAFTPYCDLDPINTIRTLLHSTAESAFYAGIGNKPCLVEEIGTLGPTNGNEEVVADFARATLFSTWANGMEGYLWWCSSEQAHLQNAPYDWIALERELGLLRHDGSAKPVLIEMGKFKHFLEKTALTKLPAKTTEAVCIISDSQDHWGTAYSTYVLSKQAGFDLDFQYCNQPLKKAALYLIPNISGQSFMSKFRFNEVLKQVSAGADLYISFNGGFMSDFEEVTGLRVTTRERRLDSSEMITQLSFDSVTLQIAGESKLTLEAVKAEVLGTEADGNPCFTCNSFGKGKIYFLGFPLEKMLLKYPGIFHKKAAQPYWQLYSYFARGILENRVIHKKDPIVGVTEHTSEDGSKIIVMINYSPELKNTSFAISEGWAISEVIYGSTPDDSNNEYSVFIGKNDAAVFKVVKG